jgi:hypothetical protein
MELQFTWGTLVPQEFYLNGKLLKEASIFLYVGIWHNLNAKDMYAEHHHIY